MLAVGFGVGGEGSALTSGVAEEFIALAAQWGVPTFRETAVGCSPP